MVTLELTDEQAKMLLIVTGNMSGRDCSRGVFTKLLEALKVDVYDVPDPYIDGTLIFVSDAAIYSVKQSLDA